MQTLTISRTLCRHCGTAAQPGHDFCCQGCESVFLLLSAKGLSHFYTLQEQFSFRKALPVSGVTAVDIPFTGRVARFYLEGVHCLGCLWLIEKLPELSPLVARARLDSAKLILEVEGQAEQTKWSEVVTLLARLGYKARPLAEDDGEAARRRDHHWQLARIGVAAFSAGNIMLLSVGIYSGTDAFWGLTFAWLSLILALPSLLFSAWPIYKSAFLPLRAGRLSVDLAIALALLAGFAMSAWSLLRGSEGEIYFDSLTMLTFLLLSSRYFLLRFRESIAKTSPCLAYLSAERYGRRGLTATALAAGEISAGDEIALRANQTLPVDAKLLEAEAHFDLSLLTGESAPVKFLRGDRVDAGAKLLTDGAAIRALGPAVESRLAAILSQIRSYDLARTPTTEFADRVGRHFVTAVLALAAAVLVAMPTEEGARRALALIIVTCPCVLAFAIPLAFSRAMQVAAARGILFLAPEKMEKLSAVKALYFDKTGTLTTGQFEVLNWIRLAGEEGEIRAATRAIEAESSHPIAKSLVRYLGKCEPGAPVEHFREIEGFGVAASVKGIPWKIGRAKGYPRAGVTTVGVWRNGEMMAVAYLGDSLRPDTLQNLDAIRALGIETRLLSGDSAEVTSVTARECGIDFWRAALLPEEKAKIVSDGPESAMVGDGANDAVAFRASGLGIAVQGAVDLSLKNADIVLTRPGIGSVLEATQIARATMKLIRMNFAITLSYNIVAGSLALAGIMQPMWAAALMPLSALSVFALTEWRTRGGKR